MIGVWWWVDVFGGELINADDADSAENAGGIILLGGLRRLCYLRLIATLLTNLTMCRYATLYAIIVFVDLQ